MEALNYGIFDDSTAYDFIDEIIINAKLFFTHSFQKAISSRYLEYRDCHAVTVSAAYLDNYLNGTSYKTNKESADDFSNINNFEKLYEGSPLDDLKPLAVKALQVVISNSELNELWSDNKEMYPKWRANIEDLINRLS